jgi:hypothetical protein
MYRLRRRSLVTWKGFLPAIALALATAPLQAQEKPEVKRLGKTVTQYRDGVVRVVLSTKYANANAGRAWVPIEFAVASDGTKPLEIERGDITLHDPEGRVVPLPSQKAMAEGVPDVQAVLHVARALAEPVAGYFPFSEYEEDLKLFTIPGEGIVLDLVGFSKNRMARGWIFFQSPTGKWNGEYQLVIKNKAVDARIPFRIPAPEFP